MYRFWRRERKFSGGTTGYREKLPYYYHSKILVWCTLTYREILRRMRVVNMNVLCLFCKNFNTETGCDKIYRPRKFWYLIFVYFENSRMRLAFFPVNIPWQARIITHCDLKECILKPAYAYFSILSKTCILTSWETLVVLCECSKLIFSRL